MKFFAAILAGGALVAASTYQDVVNDFATIQSQTTALDNSVKNYNSASQAQGIINQSNTIVASINKGTSDANGAPPFDDIQGAQLVAPVQSLNATVNTVVNDLIGKKSVLISTCQGPATYKALTQQQSAAAAFAKAVVAKVPSDLQSTAQQLAASITDALARGVSAFTDAQSLPSSCSSGGSTTAPSGGSTTSPPTSGSTSAPSGSSSVPSSSSAGSAPSYGNSTVSSVVYTTTTVCPLTMTSGGSTVTSLTTSTITVTSCAGGCTHPASGYPTGPASSAPAQTYPASSAPAQTYPAGTGSSYPSSTAGLTPYTGAASRSQLSAAIVAMIPLAFFL